MKNNLNNISCSSIKKSIAIMLMVILATNSAVLAQKDYKRFFSVDNHVFTIEVTKQSTGLMSADVYAGYVRKADNTSTFQFQNDSYEVFIHGFKNSVTKAADSSKPKIILANSDALIKFHGQAIYRELVIAEFTANEVVPMAGTIRLRTAAPVNPNEIGNIPHKRTEKLKLLFMLCDTNIKSIESIIKKLEKVKATSEHPESQSIDSLKMKMNALKQDSQRIINQNKWPGKSQSKETSGKSKESGTGKPNQNNNISKESYSPAAEKFKRRELISLISAGRMDLTNLGIQGKQYDEWIEKRKKIDSLDSTIEKQKKDQYNTIKSNIIALSNAWKSFVIINPENPFYHIQSEKFQMAYDMMKYHSKELQNLSTRGQDTILKQIDKVIQYVQQEYGLINTFDEIFITGIDSATISYKANHYAILSYQRVIDTLIVRIKTEDSISRNSKDSTHIKKSKADKAAYDQLKLYYQKKIENLKGNNDSLYIFRREIEVTQDSLMKRVKPKVENFMLILDPIRKTLKDLTILKEQLMGQVQKLSKFLEIKLYKIDSIHLEFNDGVLKNVITEGYYRDKFMVFSNPTPIQFTAISHIEKLRRVELIDMEQQKYKIALSDVLSYVPALQVDNEDYCPSDSVYNIATGTGEVVIKQAMKERVNRILDARVYTDLVGFGAGQNNGLIQFEVSKKIPLLTNRIKYDRKYRSFVSFFGFYEPKFTMAKLEQNNKYYYPLEMDDISGKRAISTIDVYKYASMRLAALYLNAFCWEVAEVKSSLEINGGFSFLYTPVRDSIAQNNIQQWGAVSGLPFGEVRIQIKPDVRYGFTLSSALGWLYLWDDKLKLINDPANPTVSDSYNRKLLSFQFDAFFRPFRHSESAAFFRLQNVHTFPMSLNYLQVQVGFAFNVFGGGGKK